MEVTLKKVLIPIDFSDNSLKAIDLAQAVVEKFGGELVLMHVLVSSPYEVYQKKGIMKNIPLYEMAGASLPGTNPEVMIKNMSEEAKKALEKLATENKLSNFRTVVSYGDVLDELLEEVKKEEIDLIVTCTHGWTGIKHLLLGSITEKLVRLSPVPVLSVPGRD